MIRGTFCPVTEVKLLLLRTYNVDCSVSYWMEFSKRETVGGFKEKMCPLFGYDPLRVQVWDFYGHKNYKQLSDDKTLGESYVMGMQEMRLELV